MGLKSEDAALSVCKSLVSKFHIVCRCVHPCLVSVFVDALVLSSMSHNRKSVLRESDFGARLEVQEQCQKL